MNTFGSPFMAKSPLDQKKRQQKLRQKIKEYVKAPNFEDSLYDNSVGEKIAQEELKEAKNKLYELEKSKEKKANSIPSAPFQKEELTNKQKRKAKKVAKKVEEARRAAFIRSNSPSEEYEESPEEKRAQRRYKRLRKRLDKKEQK